MSEDRGRDDQAIEIDATKLMAAMDDDVELLCDLVTMFEDKAPRQLADLRQALAAGDAEAVYQHAHKLKGSIGVFYVERSMAYARRVEELGRTGDMAAAAEATDALQREVAALLPALRAVAEACLKTDAD